MAHAIHHLDHLIGSSAGSVARGRGLGGGGGGLVPEGEEGTETGHLDDRTTCGLGGSGTGARPGTHEGRPRGRAEGRRADEHHRSECRVRRARRLVARLRGVASCRGRASSEVSTTSHPPRGASVPVALSTSGKSRRADSAPPHASRASAARADRVRSSVHRRRLGPRAMGDDDGEEGASPSRRQGRGRKPPDPPPATPPASGAYGALLAGWAGGGGRSVPPSAPSALSGYGAFATSSRRATDTTPNTTGKDGRDRSKRQRAAGEPPGAPAPPPPPPPRPPRTFARVSSGAKVCAKTATSAATSTATRSSRARSSPPPAGAASATSAPSDTSPSPVRILPPREPQAPRFYPRRRTRSPHTPRTAGAGCVARPIP